MLALIGSIFSGGVTGLLGVAVQRFFDVLHVKAKLAEKKIDYEHALAMRRADAELLEKEWAARTQVAGIEASGREAAADAAAFAASFQAEPKQYSAKVKPGAVTGFLLVLLDFLRGIVRPGLTLYLCVVTTLIYLEARAILAAIDWALETSQALAVHERIVATILYLTTTCVLWWFGTRNKQQPPKAAR